MGYERYPRDADRQNDRYGRQDRQEYGSDRDNYGGGRDYRSAGDLGGYDQRDTPSYGQRDYGYQGYAQNERMNRSSGWGGQDRSQDQGRERFTGGSDYYRGSDDYRPSYARGQGEERGLGRDTHRQSRGTFDRQPQRPNDDDRGFMQRAGDEVRSWFGDEDAERRREMDARENERQGRQNHGRDEHYHSWRNQQIQQFDQDYDEYRRENQSKFHNEFSSWRTERQGQRSLLSQVEEHQEVVGSDGSHVGTVDKVRGDRIILTTSDADAGGRHHSIPSRWLKSAEGGKLTLTKTADEAKQHWRDEERNGAMFGEQGQSHQGGEGSSSGANLNRSFSGTY